MAWPSLDGIIRCGERLRAWASDARFGTFVGSRFSHTEGTREIADGSAILAGTSAEGARHYVVEIMILTAPWPSSTSSEVVSKDRPYGSSSTALLIERSQLRNKYGSPLWPISREMTSDRIAGGSNSIGHSPRPSRRSLPTKLSSTSSERARTPRVQTPPRAPTCRIRKIHRKGPRR